MKIVLTFAEYIAHQTRSVLTRLIVEALQASYPHHLDKEDIEEYVQENSPPLISYTPEQISIALRNMGSSKRKRPLFTKEKFVDQTFYSLHPSLGKAV